MSNEIVQVFKMPGTEKCPPKYRYKDENLNSRVREASQRIAGLTSNPATQEDYNLVAERNEAIRLYKLKLQKNST